MQQSTTMYSATGIADTFIVTYVTMSNNKSSLICNSVEYKYNGSLCLLQIN